MDVTVTLYSVLKRYSPDGGAIVVMQLPPGASVRTLTDALGILPSEEFRTLVNGRHGTPDRVLSHNDSVSVFPVVAGG